MCQRLQSGEKGRRPLSDKGLAIETGIVAAGGSCKVYKRPPFFPARRRVGASSG
jgi:hypothetical protein